MSRAGFACRRTLIGRSSRGSSFRCGPTSGRKASKISPTRSAPTCCARARAGDAKTHPKLSRGRAERRLASLACAAGAAALALALLAAGTFVWRVGYAPRFMAASVDDKLLSHTRRGFRDCRAAVRRTSPATRNKDYFADAITDDLTTDLPHLPDSFVIARNTAFAYKGKAGGREDRSDGISACAICWRAACAVSRTRSRSTRRLISTETGAHVVGLGSVRRRAQQAWGIVG